MYDEWKTRQPRWPSVCTDADDAERELEHASTSGYWAAQAVRWGLADVAADCAEVAARHYHRAIYLMGDPTK